MKKTIKTISIIFITVGSSFLGLSDNYKDKVSDKSLNNQNDFNKVGQTSFKLEGSIPVITSQAKTFFVASHIEFSLKEIKKLVTAYDVIDGDISDDVYVHDNEYSKNKGKIGEFIIKLAVYNSRGTIGYLDILIKTYDGLAPQINGPGEIVTKDLLTTSQIISLYQVVDDIEGDISSKLKVVSNTVISNQPGEYKITLEVMDSNFNVAFVDVKYILLKANEEQDINLGNCDDFLGYISVAADEKINSSDIVQYLISNNQMAITDLANITSNYFDNANVVGKYDVIVTLTDLNDNTREVRLTIEVTYLQLNQNLEENQTNFKNKNFPIVYLSVGILLVIGIVIIKRKREEI